MSGEHPDMVTRVPSQEELMDEKMFLYGVMTLVVLCECGQPARLRARSTEGNTLVECYDCFMSAGTRGTVWNTL